MAVARVFNPNTQQWEVVAQGAKGDPGGSSWEMITGKPDLSLKADLVGGFVPTSQLPAVALTKPHVVPDRAGMLALDAQEGDVCVVTGTADKGTYMLGSGAPTSFSSWVRLSTPDAPVSSVNGQTGVVNLTAGNVGAAPTTHTHTTAQVTGLDTALAGKANTSHEHTMSQVTGLDTALAGKANTSHTHEDLQSALNGKVNTSDVFEDRVNGSIPRRTRTGTIYVSSPNYQTEAATKGYVDSRTPQIQVVTALPASPAAGVVYLVTG